MSDKLRKKAGAEAKLSNKPIDEEKLSSSAKPPKRLFAAAALLRVELVGIFAMLLSSVHSSISVLEQRLLVYPVNRKQTYADAGADVALLFTKTDRQT